MSSFAYNWLTGVVTIDVAAPEELLGDNGLSKFYRDPNNQIWGDRLCRVLYHESVHFWQFLGSGYIANLVADEWDRLVTFENDGYILAPSDSLKAFNQRSNGVPFSALELMECWVRYWDVHTRSPAQIIRDEELNVEVTAALERRRRDTDSLEYSWLAFDTVMQQGVDRALYAAPYRWMLERTSGKRWLKTKAESETSPKEQAAASSFVALVFPIITHAAFGCPEPVIVFSDAFERALNSDQFQASLEEHLTSNINFDWLNNWSFIIGEAVTPILRERQMPNFTSGYDVIERGLLGSHPVFSEYLTNFSPLRGHLNLEREFFAANPSENQEGWAIADMPLRDFWVLFGLPGQPNYRHLLGRHLPPPAVQFENTTIYAHRPTELRLQDFGSDETFENRIIELQGRVRRFRAAEKAVSLGLPPDAFE